MNFKIEQRLLNHQITECEPQIYSTGVFLVPMKVHLAGKDRYIWVANEFDEDTFFDGKNITPKFFSDDISNLIINENE